ncbi:MAG: hypothetical protein P9X22_07730 [Candidatus Zapsychrus exili]|nr:hypothetical protein [Candidatus Zapsychrus exili]
MSEELKQIIEKEISEFLKKTSLGIVDINIKVVNKETKIEIIADRQKGGITIDECSSLNKHILQKIEEEQLVEEPYSVNVASPGLDRPLENKKDFLRVIDRDVIFYLLEKIEGKKEHKGKIKEVLDNKVVINVKNESITVPFDKINKAVQVI